MIRVECELNTGSIDRDCINLFYKSGHSFIFSLLSRFFLLAKKGRELVNKKNTWSETDSWASVQIVIQLIFLFT